MVGRIVKGIAGFYYVSSLNGLYECKARGILRKRSEKPLVGDFVMFEPVLEEAKTGNISELLPRKNCLIRPEVANIDMICLVFSAVAPEPNYEMLNRYLASVYGLQTEISLVINKSELVSMEEREKISRKFINSGYNLYFVSAHTGLGIDKLKTALYNKVTSFAGPSGVGKSSLLNTLLCSNVMETGELSKKIERGRNTTRHSELFLLENETYLLDTPGFTSVDMNLIDEDTLPYCFEEFLPYLGKCRFNSCRHLKEPDCRIKEAVKEGSISLSRYRAYEGICEYYNNLRRY